MDRSPARLASNRVFLVAFACVAAVFTAGTLVSSWSARSIDRMADQIVFDESPSITHLALTRSELHRLQDFTSDYVEGNQRTGAKLAIARSRAILEREVAAYVSLAFEPGEHELWKVIEGDIAHVNRIIDLAIAAADRGDSRMAHMLVTTDLRNAVDAVGDAILRDIGFNAQRAEENAKGIENKRHWVQGLSASLDAVSIGLTAMAAYLVIRLNSRHGIIEQEHARFLEEKNAELEVFAGRMAHDVLGPLSSTRLAMESAIKTSLDERTRRRLHAGCAGVDRAVEVTNALLDFARSGARPASHASTNVHDAVAAVMSELHPLADEAGVDLDFDVEESAFVACSYGLLVSIVSNLVNNAIKYIGDGPDRRIRVRSVVGAEWVRIDVDDTGPGVAKGLEKSIFEPFVRAPDTEQPGLGLGLSTVKRIAEAHGGAVGVESHVGLGSRFWVELPRERQSTEEPVS